MELTYFATNNQATLEDMDVLHAMGIRILDRAGGPMSAFRDPTNGRVRVDIGTVTVRRDGLIKIRPREDAPDVALEILLRTAVECLERGLHKRDRWASHRATKNAPGYWRARISISVPEGDSIFSEYVEVLRPAVTAFPRERADNESDALAPEHPRTVAA